MTAKITKDSIDLGIVVSDSEKALAFYRDVIGLPHLGDMPMGGGSVMHRLAAGDTVIKLVSLATKPETPAAPGGINGALGYRYFTISVSNIEEVAAACTAAGVTIAVPVLEFRPGITILIVEDPDGNWVEFLQAS